MKIICTKEEFATLLSNCIASTGCVDCALSGICENEDDTSTLVNICEIKEPEEQQ